MIHNKQLQSDSATCHAFFSKSPPAFYAVELGVIRFSNKDEMMRLFLLILGWSSVIGSIGDGTLGIYSLWVVAQSGWVDLNLSVDLFLQQYVQFIYWIKQIAYYVLPENFVIWVFNLPALVYFPVRIVMSIIIGWWALSKAAQLSNKKVMSTPV